MIIKINSEKYGTHDLLIDDEDYDKVKKYKWHLKPSGYTNYARTNIYKDKKHKYLRIHRLIMGLGDFKDDKRVVNHVNGNGLDNRKCNLEICSQNYNNQSINKPNVKFGHVSYHKQGKLWRYKIHLWGKNYEKYFKTREEALKGLCMIELKEKYEKIINKIYSNSKE